MSIKYSNKDNPTEVILNNEDVKCVKIIDENGVSSTAWSKPITIEIAETETSFGKITSTAVATSYSDAIGIRGSISNATYGTFQAYWGDTLNIQPISENIPGYNYTFIETEVSLYKNSTEISTSTTLSNYNILSYVDFNTIKLNSKYTRTVAHFTLNVEFDTLYSLNMFENQKIEITKNPTGEKTNYTSSGTYDLTRFSSGDLDNIEYSYDINGYAHIKDNATSISIETLPYDFDNNYIKPDNYTLTIYTSSTSESLRHNDIAKNQTAKLVASNIDLTTKICDIEIHTPARGPGEINSGGCYLIVENNYTFNGEDRFVLKSAFLNDDEIFAQPVAYNPHAKYVALTGLRVDGYTYVSLKFEKVPQLFIDIG